MCENHDDVAPNSPIRTTFFLVYKIHEFTLISQLNGALCNIWRQKKAATHHCAPQYRKCFFFVFFLCVSSSWQSILVCILLVKTTQWYSKVMEYSTACFETICKAYTSHQSLFYCSILMIWWYVAHHEYLANNGHKNHPICNLLRPVLHTCDTWSHLRANPKYTEVVLSVPKPLCHMSFRTMDPKQFRGRHPSLPWFMVKISVQMTKCVDLETSSQTEPTLGLPKPVYQKSSFMASLLTQSDGGISQLNLILLQPSPCVYELLLWLIKAGGYITWYMRTCRTSRWKDVLLNPAALFPAPADSEPCDSVDSITHIFTPRPDLSRLWPARHHSAPSLHLFHEM